MVPGMTFKGREHECLLQESVFGPLDACCSSHCRKHWIGESRAAAYNSSSC